MIRLFSIALCLATISFFSLAQETLPEKHTKLTHYVGLQANELIRQLVNLNNNNTANTNPYLLTYAVNNIYKPGWGLHGGIGYNYNSIVDKTTQVNRETRVNDLSYRLGIEKRFRISNRFEAGIGIDYVAGWKLDKTFSVSVFNNGSGPDSTATTATTKTTYKGEGPLAFLGFHITDKIMLGTETSMYYTARKEKQNILNIRTVTNTFNNNDVTISTSDLNTGSDIKNFTLNVPVVLFLIVKF